MCGVSGAWGRRLSPSGSKAARRAPVCAQPCRGSPSPSSLQGGNSGPLPTEQGGSAAQGVSKGQKPGWTHRAQQGWGGAPWLQSQSRRVSPAPSLGLSVPRQAEGGGELSPASPQPPRCPGRAVGGRRGPGCPHQMLRGGARCTVAMVMSSPVSL